MAGAHQLTCIWPVAAPTVLWMGPSLARSFPGQLMLHSCMPDGPSPCRHASLPHGATAAIWVLFSSHCLPWRSLHLPCRQQIGWGSGGEQGEGATERLLPQRARLQLPDTFHPPGTTSSHLWVAEWGKGSPTGKLYTLAQPHA